MQRPFDIADGQAPCFARSEAPAEGFHPLRVGHQCAGFAQQVAALLGEMNPLLAAVEQVDTQLVFQLLDLPAQRRLGNVEPLGGLADIFGFGHCDEVAKLAQLKHG